MRKNINMQGYSTDKTDRTPKKVVLSVLSLHRVSISRIFKRGESVPKPPRVVGFYS